MDNKVSDQCICWTPLDDSHSGKIRKYRPSPGPLALEDWRQRPFFWLHYVESNNGLQIADYVLRSDDTCFWSIPDVQRYFLGKLHCEEVLFTCQYPNLEMPTALGNHLWRSHVAQKRPPAIYLKEFHTSLHITLKRMETEQSQIDRLILSDQLIQIDRMDYYKRRKFFESLLNVLCFQDSLQLVCLENLKCLRLEGVRLIQQIACFNAHSLKYLFLWNFVRNDENPLLVNYSYITGSGKYIPRPVTSQCFSRSLGELRNLRVLALEYGHIADGTGNALMSLLPILKRPHFRLQLLCIEEHTPGRADPSLGGGGNGIPDYVWRRISIACPDLFLVMVLYRMRDYDHTTRILTASVPLREIHLQQGMWLNNVNFDTESFVRHVVCHFASTLVTLSIHQSRNGTFPLQHTLQRLSSLVRFYYVGSVVEKDLHDTLILVACGVCYKLKEIKIFVEADKETRDVWGHTVSNLCDKFNDIMQLFDVDVTLKVY